MCLSDSLTVIIDPIDVRGTIPFGANETFIDNLKVSVACGDWFEICIDRSKIFNDEISIRFELEKDGKVIQTLPGFGELKIDLGDDYSHNWFV